MRSIPDKDWNDRSAGGLTQANWLELVSRIPPSYHGNPHYNVADGELPLEFVPLDDFLEEHPSACCFLFILGPMLIHTSQNMQVAIPALSITLGGPCTLPAKTKLPSLAPPPKKA